MAHSQETKNKISKALSKKVQFICDYCGDKGEDKPSSYARKKRHFCSMNCYSRFRKELLPKDEQHAYKGGGMPENEKALRVKARSDLNHAIGQGKLKRLPCESCGEEKSEGHHHDYEEPLDVKWLCKRCHHVEHSLIYENTELLVGDL